MTLACLHLYLGAFAGFVTGDRATQFVVIGLALLAGPMLYFTAYWRRILYLPGAGFVMYLGWFWLSSRDGFRRPGCRTSARSYRRQYQ